MYVTALFLQQKYGIPSSTLRRWDRTGKIATIRTPGNFRRNKLQGFLSSPSLSHL